MRFLKTLHRSCSTVLVAILVAALMVCFPQNAVATELPALASGNVRIHVLPFDNMDAIVVECDGHFGVVDSGEDSLSPDGSDFRYPVRPGTTEGMGKEDQVIAYMKQIGVTQDNLDFYIGTHPHSDHIGSASQIIHEFHPKTIYTPEYDDSLITDYSRLWDNQFVYDRLVAAALWAQEEYGARFIQHLDPDPVDPTDPTDPIDPTDSDADEGSTRAGSSDNAGSMGGESTGTTDVDTGTGTAASASASSASEAATTVSIASQPQAAKMTTAAFSSTSSATMNSVARTGDMDAGDGSTESDDRTGKPVFKLGSATIEIMNYDESYLTTKAPDANYYSYGVKVTAANGRTAFLAGDINNYTDGDGDGVGDEDRLKATLGTIDFLKMGHHGRSGSNTTDYLNAILKAAQGEDRAVVVQTGVYSLMPSETIAVLNEKGARHFHAADAATWGHAAFVADLTAAGVKTNVDGDDTTTLQLHGSEPYATMYKNGLPYAVTGWHEGSDGNLYYFGEAGSAGSATPLTNCWATYKGNRIFIGNQGYKALNWQKIDGIWYYFNSDGSLRYGWQQIKGKWYYFDPATGAMQTGWQKVKGTWYYLNPETGKMATGWAKVDDTWYYLNSSGAMQKGWLKLSGAWYHLQNSGAMSTGWAKVNGKWYYLDPSSGKMATGWALVDNTWYFLNSSGAMQKGWLKRGGTWYHLQNSGAMSTGWAKVNGKWYYLNPENGKMKTGWALVDGTWYRLNSSGAMLKGWQKIGGKWYHLQNSGAMTIGWLDDRGKTYYLTESGAMATGTRTIDGKQYTFSSSGALR